MEDIQVSVLCVTYNHEPYIREALESFVNQKVNFRFEVIVFDDASTDNTPLIIKEYEKKYPEIIKPIYQKINTYGETGRFEKYILPHIKGKYSSICEGDDYWINENKIQEQYDYMEAHPECSLVAGKAKILYCETGIINDYSNIDFTFSNWNVPIEMAIRKLELFPTATMFYRTEFFYANKDFIRTHHIYDYVKKILLATEGTVHIIPHYYSVYRKNSANSWSIRIASDNSKMIQHFTESIASIEDINAYRNYMYDSILSTIILERKFKIEILKKNFAVLRDEPYKQLYDNMSASNKLSMYINGYFPSLYKSLKRIFKH